MGVWEWGREPNHRITQSPNLPRPVNPQSAIRNPQSHRTNDPPQATPHGAPYVVTMMSASASPRVYRSAAAGLLAVVVALGVYDLLLGRRLSDRVREWQALTAAPAEAPAGSVTSALLTGGQAAAAQAPAS